jgi:hypothetical protein
MTADKKKSYSPARRREGWGRVYKERRERFAFTLQY